MSCAFASPFAHAYVLPLPADFLACLGCALTVHPCSPARSNHDDLLLAAHDAALAAAVAAAAAVGVVGGVRKGRPIPELPVQPHQLCTDCHDPIKVRARRLLALDLSGRAMSCLIRMAGHCNFHCKRQRTACSTRHLPNTATFDKEFTGAAQFVEPKMSCSITVHIWKGKSGPPMQQPRSTRARPQEPRSDLRASAPSSSSSSPDSSSSSPPSSACCADAGRSACAGRSSRSVTSWSSSSLSSSLPRPADEDPSVLWSSDMSSCAAQHQSRSLLLTSTPNKAGWKLETTLLSSSCAEEPCSHGTAHSWTEAARQTRPHVPLMYGRDVFSL